MHGGAEVRKKILLLLITIRPGLEARLSIQLKCRCSNHSAREGR